MHTLSRCPEAILVPVKVWRMDLGFLEIYWFSQMIDHIWLKWINNNPSFWRLTRLCKLMEFSEKRHYQLFLYLEIKIIFWITSKFFCLIKKCRFKKIVLHFLVTGIRDDFCKWTFWCLNPTTMKKPFLGGGGRPKIIDIIKNIKNSLLCLQS